MTLKNAKIGLFTRASTLSIDEILQIKQLFLKIWNSPILMTWGGFTAKSLSFVIVIPFILTRLSAAEISVYFLFATVQNLQIVIDAGFSPTFSRIISYAMGGCCVNDLHNPESVSNGLPNYEALVQIYLTMMYIYTRLSVIWGSILIFSVSFFFIHPINQMEKFFEGWIAWSVIIGGSVISFYGLIFNSYLQGINKIAVHKRWEMLTSICAIITTFIVLYLGGRLLGLVIANQIWMVIGVVRNYMLAKHFDIASVISLKGKYNSNVFRVVWPSAWRSGVGILMGYGLIHGSGIIYAQIEKASEVAEYLFALRIIQIITQFSQAPFYSGLSYMAQLYTSGKNEELIKVAKHGMALSYWSYVIPFFCLGLFGNYLLQYISSNICFPSQNLWVLLGIGFFIERYGAMHLQFYTLSNDIIWHTASGGFGFIYMLFSLLGFKYLGIYALPLGIILGHVGFYSWYSAYNSYKKYIDKPIKFEIMTFIPAALFFSISILILLFFDIFNICNKG